jgi:hypothetical protein
MSKCILDEVGAGISGGGDTQKRRQLWVKRRQVLAGGHKPEARQNAGDEADH